MKVSFDISHDELKEFENSCMAAIRNVGEGTKRGTTQACEDIMEESFIQVPKDTWTMKASGFYKVSRRGDIKGYRYEAILGYGGNGDPVNPKTGKRASSYMVSLHEDLSMPHQNGKAKFLEDPVREYAAGKFYRTIFDYAREALASMTK